MMFRSLLFAPGNHPRRVAKALTLAADVVILDLEDAVAVLEKETTRSKVVAVYDAPRSASLYVRVNSLTTEWCHGDLTAVVRRGLDGIILPKVESPHDLHIADWMIGNLERVHGLPAGSIDLMPIIETGLGVSNLAAVCRSNTRVRRLAFGAGDFTLDVGIAWTRSEVELHPYRAACVLESRAAGLQPPIDTVWADMRDMDGFLASASCAARLGFQGKMCIHPDQVAGANEAFSPDTATIARARQIIEAFELAERDGLASIQLDGQFIDYPIVERARRIVRQGGA